MSMTHWLCEVHTVQSYHCCTNFQQRTADIVERQSHTAAEQVSLKQLGTHPLFPNTEGTWSLSAFHYWI